MSKKIISALLALLTLASFAACSDSGTNGGNDTADTSSADTTVTETTVPETTIPAGPDLPEVTYDGYEFRFGVRGLENDGGQFSVHDVSTEELNGEVFNDAIYNRQKTIEEKYDITIKKIYMGETGYSLGAGDMFAKAQKTILAGEDAYDCFISSVYDAGSLSYNGLVNNLTDYEYLGLENDWYDQNAIKAMTMNDKLFIVSGDFTTIGYYCTHCLFFCKPLITDFSLESPYQLVQDGKWTLDKMFEMSAAVTDDINGDGEMNDEDRYGFYCWSDSINGLMQGSDNYIALNIDDKLTLTLDTEHAIEWWGKIVDFAKTDSLFNATTDKDVYASFGTYNYIEFFLQNKTVLFASAYVGYANDLRAMDVDFGIIPHAKYDESQEDYNSATHGNGCMLSIPITNVEYDRTGIILNDFTYESSLSVIPAYYELNLISKSLRDDDSEDMLDIIFGHRTYDLGFFYQVGGLPATVRSLWCDRNTDLASTYAKSQSVAQKDVDKVNENYYK